MPFSPTHGQPIAGGTTELIVGLATAVGGGLTATIIDKIYGDVYEKVLKRPIANLVERLRSNPTPSPQLIMNVIVETWFTQDELLVQVVVRRETTSLKPFNPAPILRSALLAVAQFLNDHQSNATPDVALKDSVKLTIETDGGPSPSPLVLRIVIAPDGALGGPEFIDPRRRFQ